MNAKSSQYIEDMSRHEQALDRGHKKANGVFYTDFKLAEIIIDDLMPSADTTIIDPCCGVGSFLVAASNYGCHALFGCDVSRSSCSLVKKHCSNAAVKAIDTLAYSGRNTMKKLGIKQRFDIVIGNPPYAPLGREVTIKTKDLSFLSEVQSNGSNLFVAALLRAFELARTDGLISYILPKNLLHVDSYKKLREKLLNQKTIISITDIGSYFKNVRGEQIILTIKNSYTENNSIIIRRLNNDTIDELCRVPQSGFEDKILLFDSDIEHQLYKKLSQRYISLEHLCTSPIRRGRPSDPDAISGKELRKFGFKGRMPAMNSRSIFVQNIYSSESGIIASAGGDLLPGQTITVIETANPRQCKYILGLLHSRLCNYYLYKFCYNSSRLTMHTDSRYIGVLPVSLGNDKTYEKVISFTDELERAEYLSEKWHELFESLNQAVYEAYSLSGTEISYIENQIKQVQSKRWLKNG